MFTRNHPQPSSWLIAGVAILSCLSASACANAFDSQMALSGYRVIGIEVSSPEVLPESVVELKVHDFYDGDRPVLYNWSVCLYSHGAAESYACTDKDWEFPLGTEASLVWDLGADGFALREKLDALPWLPNEDGSPRSLEQGFDVWLKLRSGPDCSSCEVVETVKRLTVSEHSEATANQNPVIESFEVVGATRAGASVTLRAVTDTPQAYADPHTQLPVKEEYLYSWYSSDGAAEPTRTFGATQETKLKLPTTSGPLKVILAVRDGRGGLAVSERTIEVQ